MALTEVLAKFTTQVDTAPIKAGDAAVSSFVKKLEGIGNAIAGAAVLDRLRSMTTEMVDFAGALVDTSARLGVSTNDLQQWQYFAVKAGADAADVEPVFRTLSKNIAEVGGESAKGAGLLKTLGVSTKDAHGQLRPMGEIATDAGLAIASLNDPAQRSKAALELFGKSGTRLLPLFAQGREGMAGFVDEFERFGGPISEDTIAALDEVGDATDGLDLAWRGLKAQIIVGVAPAIAKATTKFAEVFAMLKKASETGHGFRNVLIGVGVAGAAAGAAALAPWLLTITALALVGLAVDDVITAFEGGDSVLTDFLDKVFGEGAGKSIMQMIKSDTTDLWKEIEKAPTVSSKFDAAFSGIGGGLKKFFAEELPAAIGVATGSIEGTETTWSNLYKSNISDPIDAAIAEAKAKVKAWLDLLKAMAVDAAKDAVRAALEVPLQGSGVVGQLGKAGLDRALGADRTPLQKAINTYGSDVSLAQIAEINARGGAGAGVNGGTTNNTTVTQSSPVSITLNQVGDAAPDLLGGVVTGALRKNSLRMLGILEARK